MNILHISDLHFGTRHWDGDNERLLAEINSYPADLVINTGDSTTDSLESEYLDAERFLQGLTCENVISIAGNHDKRNMRSHEFFRKHIDHDEIIFPSRPELTNKKNIFLQQDITKTENFFTDLNYVKLLNIDGKTVLVICIDSTIQYEDEGFVEKEILRSISSKIKYLQYNNSMLLIHHSLLTMDSEPLRNSFHVTEFIREHKIENVFCGHTHRLDLRKSTDLCFKSYFTQYMVGSLSSRNLMGNDNQFLYLENWGTSEMRIHLIRIRCENEVMSFIEELI